MCKKAKVKMHDCMKKEEYQLNSGIWILFFTHLSRTQILNPYTYQTIQHAYDSREFLSNRCVHLSIKAIGIWVLIYFRHDVCTVTDNYTCHIYVFLISLSLVIAPNSRIPREYRFGHWYLNVFHNVVNLYLHWEYPIHTYYIGEKWIYDI